MTSRTTYFALLALLACPCACDDVGASADRLREEGARALERFEVERVRVEGELEQHLEELSAQLADLEARGEEHLDGLLRDLEAQREVARAKLADLRAAGEEAWDDLREDAEREVGELQERSREVLGDR